MNSFNSNWLSTYDFMGVEWFSDSLNWNKSSFLYSTDINWLNSIIESSFLSQHMSLDSIFKIVNLDVLITCSSLTTNSNTTLYLDYINDNLFQIFVLFLPFSFLFNFEYQDTLTTIILVSPEMTNLFNDYILIYINNTSFYTSISKVFDSYTNNFNYFIGTGIIDYMFYLLVTIVLSLFFLSLVLTRWSVFTSTYFTRYYYYFFSFSRETRVQFDVVYQTFLFFLLYWLIVLLTFDDENEECIEFFTSILFTLFNLVILYLVYKYSIHFYSFLDKSVEEGRSVSFIISQFSKDALNGFSILLRFYILLFRLNMYDTLEDILDTYYIFFNDFNDDEYINELFISLHGTLSFSFDNQDGRLFLLEEEHDFLNDLFYLYFLIWGKLFYWLFFTIDDGCRILLALYLTFIVLYDINSVNNSYVEDCYMSRQD